MYQLRVLKIELRISQYWHPLTFFAGICFKKPEVYPNPVNNELTVSGSFLEGIQLFNPTGTQKLDVKSAGGGQVKIDLSEFPGGIYFLKVGDKYFKIVKQ